MSYLPLAAVAVRAGATDPRGRAARHRRAGHGGLHLGVRREGDPFGYEDPMTLLAGTRRVRRAPAPGPRDPARRAARRRRRGSPRAALAAHARSAARARLAARSVAGLGGPRAAALRRGRIGDHGAAPARRSPEPA